MPNMGSCALTLLNEQTNVIMLGKSSTSASLAAVGLGNMMQNCLGLSIGWGLLAALDSLVSQAYGAGNQAVACEQFQRGRFIATLQLLWIIPRQRSFASFNTRHWRSSCRISVLPLRPW
eukprot:g33390.t1